MSRPHPSFPLRIPRTPDPCYAMKIQWTLERGYRRRLPTIYQSIQGLKLLLDLLHLFLPLLSLLLFGPRLNCQRSPTLRLDTPRTVWYSLLVVMLLSVLVLVVLLMLLAMLVLVVLLVFLAVLVFVMLLMFFFLFGCGLSLGFGSSKSVAGV